MIYPIGYTGTLDPWPTVNNNRYNSCCCLPKNLQHLEQLTKKARALAGEAEPEDVSLSSIASKLAKLQEVHSRIQESLVSGSEQLIAARLRQEIGDAQAECTSVQIVPEEAFDDRIITNIFREFPWNIGKDSNGQSEESARILYTIENKLICGFKDYQIAVQFDTYHEGKLVESFYLVLVGRSAFESLCVLTHTIPFYVPLKEVEREYLSSNAAMFISILGDLLQAYVSRREQIRKFKETRSDKLRLISHTVLCDAVDFMVEESDCKVTVKLGYEDLHSDLPSVAKVAVWPPPASKGKFPAFFSKDRKPKTSPISLLFAEIILQQEVLPEAYERLVSGLNAILAGRPVDDPELDASALGHSIRVKGRSIWR
ncbi:hypothetical protein GOP47_0000318 [Adiantum capillus-veneris]|uniref:Centromere protein O n=1 Tax=Adiantum capillus-veneris TaxID=13818 RepID=A0A9D4VD36_ADICA|nr:hypothetical protein GOP47_0000318 [Adiantum capillus-veneris]